MHTNAIRLFSLLKDARKVLICGHRSPDGDAVGSCLAWAEYLRHLGKATTIMLPSPPPDFLRWLPGFDQILFYERHENVATRIIQRHDLVCCLDFSQLPRLQGMEKAVRQSRKPRLCIDHHLEPAVRDFDVLISDPDACSTCEVVCRLLQDLGGWEALTPQGATALYTGMMTDTGAFTYNSTRPEIYHTIAALLAKGIDKDRIYRNIYNVFSPDRLRLQGYLMSQKLTFYAHNRASIYTLTRAEQEQFHFLRGDGEGIVNLPLQVKGMQLSISLREDTERPVIRVSLRSVDDLDCRAIAERHFNGGGHLNASGGELPMTIEEAVAVAQRAIAETFPEPPQNDTPAAEAQNARTDEA